MTRGDFIFDTAPRRRYPEHTQMCVWERCDLWVLCVSLSRSVKTLSIRLQGGNTQTRDIISGHEVERRDDVIAIHDPDVQTLAKGCRPRREPGAVTRRVLRARYGQQRARGERRSGRRR